MILDEYPFFDGHHGCLYVRTNIGMLEGADEREFSVPVSLL
jgi:hypothetical protein